MKKLLIIYATYGTGHKSIANYVDDYFIKSGEYETLKIDLLDYSKKSLGKFTSGFYNFTQKAAPFLWEVVYRTADNKPIGRMSSKLQTTVVDDKKLKKIIIDYKPDLVIATHFTGASYIAKLIKNKELNTKLISIVTDYRAHEIWLDTEDVVSSIIVNSEDEKKLLVKKGMNPNIIKTFGIPVSSNYSMKLYDKEALMKKFHLNGDKPVILFYGGGGGGTNLSIPYLITLIESKIDAEVFFVCGRSEELKHHAESIVKKFKCTNIHVLGFISNGPEYMMVSDFVITKPGGITTTECICFKRPMVLIKGNGGQEKDNYRFLTKKGYAINAVGLIKFKNTLKKLTTNKDILEDMRKRMDKVDKEEAMKKLFNLAKETIDRK